jgi:hypothetical protein
MVRRKDDPSGSTAVAAPISLPGRNAPFPAWLGTRPALVKAFFEQLFRPGVAAAQRKLQLPLAYPGKYPDRQRSDDYRNGDQEQHSGAAIRVVPIF